ncbi:MAG TPA: uroporphyrinogen-III synthase [Bacteroidales bacterium]
MKVKNILVSQPSPTDLEKSPYGDLAKKHSLNIDFHQFIKVEGINAQDFRRAKGSFNNHTAVVLTSRHAVDHFFRMAKELRFEIPDSLKYFCISESTAYYLQKYVQYRKRKIFYGKQNFIELVEVIKKHKEESFLIPSSDIHKDTMFEMLDEEKINYSNAIIYKTVSSNLLHLDINKYNLIIFFSPAGIKSLLTNFPNFQQGETLIGTFGTTTANAVKEAGFRLDIPGPTQSAPSMTMAVDEYLTKQAKEAKKSS